MSELITQQQSLDKVRKAFLQEKAPWAISENAGCVYRGVNWEGQECKCAFGQILPDDKYNPKMEGMTARGFFDYSIMSKNLIPMFKDAGSAFKPEFTNANFYDRLQEAHDTLARHVKEGEVTDEVARLWLEDKLKCIAATFKLQW
jgi:hypothetical protein